MNIAGAVGVIAVSNVFGHLRFPYVFGGDGVTMIIPPDCRQEAISAVCDSAAIMKKSFGLTVRVGAVTVDRVRREAGDVRIARMRISEKYVQASLDGPGIDYAEHLLKSDQIPVVDEVALHADTSGFSCRWDELPSQSGETLALIIEATSRSASEKSSTMREVAGAIDRCVGTGQGRNPVSRGRQRMIRSLRQMKSEALVHSRGSSRSALRREQLRIAFQILVVHAALMFRTGWRMANGKLLRGIPEHNVLNADFQKYDGRLKTVINCTPEQRAALVAELEQLEAEGRIIYGVHISDRAVMTCLIHARKDEEVHFIDAADGGYAQAAVGFKKKFAALTRSPAEGSPKEAL